MPKFFGRLAAILFFLAAASCFVTAAAGPLEELTTRMIIGGACAGLAGAILVIDALGAIEKTGLKIVTREQANHSILGNIEVHGKRNRAKKPEIELYITVEEKAQNE